jgi:carnitine O-acetyltransferase
MEPEKIGKAQIPLDSTAFKYMFNACRIPRRFQDSYRIYDPSRYTHAIVARKGHFFAIDIVDKKSGNPLPVTVLEDQLQQCIELAAAIPPSRPKLGILTTTNRDNWADARKELLDAGGKSMEKALEILESGAVLVSLDDSSLTDKVECSEMFLTGRQLSGDNRWFDKSIQLIVQNNGRAGCTNEHSMMDGMPTVKLVDYITKTSYAEVKEKSKDDAEHPYQVLDIFGGALEEMDLSLLKSLENRGMFCARFAS